MKKRQAVIAVFTLAVVGFGVLAFITWQKLLKQDPAEPAKQEEGGPRYQLIGTSVEGRKIEAYSYGNGEKELLFIGGIHGGYEWNSVLLAYTFIDYFEANPDSIPTNLTVTVVPSLNPDGVYKVIGTEGRFEFADVPPNISAGFGRLNANTVDLNRNFDCKWQPEGVWRNNVVSAGSAPFSEPEIKAIRDFVLEHTPVAVVFWHSQANAVYPGECGGDILPETRDIMNAYAHAAGY